MAYTLYYSPGSSNLVVRIVLEELDVAYSDALVARRSAERGPEFMRLNPRGLVPVLVDHGNEVTVFETAAILLYLADRHDRLAPPLADPRSRADCLKWLFMLSNTVHAELNMRFYAEQYVGDACQEGSYFVVNGKRIFDHFRVLDDAVAEHGESTLLASGLSICDFYLGGLVRWSQIYPRGNPALGPGQLQTFANLMRVLGSVQALPSVGRSLAREQISGPAFVDPCYSRRASIAPPPDAPGRSSSL